MGHTLDLIASVNKKKYRIYEFLTKSGKGNDDFKNRERQREVHL